MFISMIKAYKQYRRRHAIRDPEETARAFRAGWNAAQRAHARDARVVRFYRDMIARQDVTNNNMGELPY